MISSEDKLAHDVEVLVEMAVEAAAYLDSEVLFWPLNGISSPKMTLGGYLMRQHRLLALEALLDEEQNQAVASAVVQFNSALANRVVRFETKANYEMEARIRQWEAYLNDVDKGSGSKFNYDTAVEPRVMLTALQDALQTLPYRITDGNLRQMTMADLHLRRNWKSGEFVWPEGWVAAYPESEYWFLYGAPHE